MTKEERERLIILSQDVILHTENDIKEFEGKPFNGRTVAELFGNISAGICALTTVLIKILEDET